MSDDRPATPAPLDLAGLLGLDREGFVTYYQAGGDMTALTPFTAAWNEAVDQTLQVTTVRLPRALLARLDAVSGRDRSGRSGVIRAAVEQYLDGLESPGP